MSHVKHPPFCSSLKFKKLQLFPPHQAYKVLVHQIIMPLILWFYVQTRNSFWTMAPTCELGTPSTIQTAYTIMCWKTSRLYDIYEWHIMVYILTHWGRVTHICVSKLTIIGPDNGLSPGRRQAIIWTNAGIWLIRPLETNFSEILIKIHTFSFPKIYLKMSSGKRGVHFASANELSDTGSN